jgi:hypothetical protein
MEANELIAAPTPFHSLTVAVPLRVAGEILHVGRSKLYELLGAGKLQGVKDGGGPTSRLMVTVESIKEYQSTYTPAKIAPPRDDRKASLRNLRAARNATK